MLKIKALTNKRQTAEEMYRLVRQYSSDLHHIYVLRGGKMVALSALPIWEFFDFVRLLKYKVDCKPIEIILRPSKIIELARAGIGIDCKKKAILIASYLKEKKLPYRFIASSNRQDKQVHHVFPQLQFAGEWLNFDATYAKFRPFERRPTTKTEVL